MYRGTQNWKEFVADQKLSDVPGDWDDGLLQKAQYDTSNDGHVNALFTSTLYAQYNKENNFYAALPQVNRFSGNLQGPVTAKAFRASHNPVPLQTHSEGGAVPDGETFDVEKVEYDVKRSETVAEVSDLQQIHSMIEDAVGFDEFWEEQEDQLDLAIDRDAIGEAVSSGAPAYEDTDTITELDRVIASGDEEAEAQDPDGVGYEDGDLDVANIDRSADPWADSFVNFEAAGGTRQLNADLMDEFIRGFNEFADVNPYENCAILTGHTTAGVLSDLMADKGQPRTNVAAGGTEEVGDAETIVGLTGQTNYRHYDGIPIVANQNAPAHGDIESIYMISTDTIRGQPRIGVEQYAEPYTETAGRGQQQGYFSTGEFREKAMMMLNHEVVCRDFSSQAKLRDLAE